MQKTPLFNLQKPVAIIGDVMLDIYLKGKSYKISPEAPVPVVRFNENQYTLGGAGNVALNLKKLGVDLTLFGLIGDDEHGKRLIQLLDTLDIKHHLIVTKQPTITKMRIVDHQHQLLRVDYEHPFQYDDSIRLIDSMIEHLTASHLCIISDYAKGTVALPQKLIEQPCQTIVDPKGHCYEKYQGAFLVTPNLKEFQEASQSNETHIDQLIQSGSSFRQKMNIQNLLITLSERGMLLINDKYTLHQPVIDSSQVSDVTGAGDTVIATLTACLSSNIDFEKALQITNHAASLVVKQFGTAYVCPNELSQSLLSKSTLHNKTRSLSTLISILKEHQQQNQKIVFTNGCFDIIHPGHIALLEKAKSFGDILVVAINSDDSIQRLKGPHRPINTLTSRVAVMAGLQAVDWVITFDDDTPLQLIRAIAPDVLVKGGDYSVDTIVGAQDVINNGGEVKVVPTLDNYSTTSLIKSVLEVE